jgi:cob(I)alamin adenosyltransferase
LAEKKRKGLIIVHTGNGKGKTTAAMGMALRGVGYGHRVVMLQFIKGSWKYGELEAAKQLHPFFEIIPMGRGFIRYDREDPAPEDIQAAEAAWAAAKEKILSGDYHMVILDEINYTMDYGLIPVEDVVQTLKAKPADLHVVLTGRNAPDPIIDIADLVTEMKEIKHPFQKGIKAQKGIEY